ncbi:MAG: fliQ [Bacteriovoracaceae bacterium]|nr:fliQ [Bacteriovoracaceae bacterium]
MTPAFIQGVGIEVLKTILIISMPVLLVALAVGLVISIVQAATQIQEQTLAFIPKMVSIYIFLILFGGFIMDRLMSFSTQIFSDFSRYVK